MTQAQEPESQPQTVLERLRGYLMSIENNDLLAGIPTEVLMEWLLVREQAMLDATRECEKWAEEQRRLTARIKALKKAIEILT